MERDPKSGSFSGLTDDEAKSFHSIFMGSFVLFTIIAILAHIAVYMWRPWLPPVGGYQTGSLSEGVTQVAAFIAPLFG